MGTSRGYDEGRRCTMLNPRLTLTLSLAAGLLGGLFSRYVSPTPAQAQTAAPAEIRAQKFTLVDQNGTVRGVFAVDNPVEKGGHTVIKLFDIGGREVWSTSPPLERLVDGGQ
jgi:hypothetical protein